LSGFAAWLFLRVKDSRTQKPRVWFRLLALASGLVDERSQQTDQRLTRCSAVVSLAGMSAMLIPARFTHASASNRAAVTTIGRVCATDDRSGINRTRMGNRGVQTNAARGRPLGVVFAPVVVEVGMGRSPAVQARRRGRRRAPSRSFPSPTSRSTAHEGRRIEFAVAGAHQRVHLRAISGRRAAVWRFPARCPGRWPCPVGSLTLKPALVVESSMALPWTSRCGFRRSRRRARASLTVEPIAARQQYRLGDALRR